MNASEIALSVGSALGATAVVLVPVRRALSRVAKIAGEHAADLSVLAGANQASAAQLAQVNEKVSAIAKAVGATQVRIDDAASAVASLADSQQNYTKFAWRNEQRLAALCERTLAAVGAQCQATERLERCVVALNTKPSAKR